MRALVLLLAILCLNVEAQITFQHIGLLPDHATLGCASFIMGDKFYMVGGVDSIQSFKGRVREYNILTNIWTSKSDPPFISGESFGTSTANAPFVIDGIDSLGNFIKKGWRYYPINDSWQELPAPIEKRARSSTFSNGRYVFQCFGPDSLYNMTSSMWSYDTLFKHWHVLSCPLSPRGDVSVSVLDSFAYIVGGGDSNYYSLNEIWRYNMNQDSWYRLPDIPNDSGRSSPFVYSFKNMLLVCFGAYVGNTVLYQPKTTIYKLDFTTLNWSLVTYSGGLSPGAGQFFFQYNKKCYLFGGVRDLSYSLFSDMWMFDPAPLHPEYDGIEEMAEDVSNIAIYPNPTRDKFLIRSDKDMSSVLVYDMTGKLLASANSPAKTALIDCSAFSRGVYVVRVCDQDNTVSTHKVVIE